MKVYKAINAVQQALAIRGITKDRTNSFDNYKFRGIDDVYQAISPLLAEHGLCILPRMVDRQCEERQSQKGGALFYVTVTAEFDFVSSEDGTSHTVRTYGEAMDRGDKATNKAMSAAYKYAAFQAFAIPTEGNPDADAETHQVKPKDVAHSGPAIIFSELQPEVQDHLRRAAPIIVKAMPDTSKAIELIEQTLDDWPDDMRNEVKAGLWSLLDSKTRSAIKAHKEQ